MTLAVFRNFRITVKPLDFDGFKTRTLWVFQGFWLCFKLIPTTNLFSEINLQFHNYSVLASLYVFILRNNLPLPFPTTSATESQIPHLSSHL